MAKSCPTGFTSISLSKRSQTKSNASCQWFKSLKCRSVETLWAHFYLTYCSYSSFMDLCWDKNKLTRLTGCSSVAKTEDCWFRIRPTCWETSSRLSCHLITCVANPLTYLTKFYLHICQNDRAVATSLNQADSACLKVCISPNFNRNGSLVYGKLC